MFQLWVRGGLSLLRLFFYISLYAIWAIAMPLWLSSPTCITILILYRPSSPALIKSRYIHDSLSHLHPSFIEVPLYLYTKNLDPAFCHFPIGKNSRDHISPGIAIGSRMRSDHNRRQCANLIHCRFPVLSPHLTLIRYRRCTSFKRRRHCFRWSPVKTHESGHAPNIPSRHKPFVRRTSVF